ncbi:MAG: phosphoribosylamine--glycine ligase [Phycisphaerae bacterium]
MKILLIGNGGREHAMAWKMAQSPHTSRLFCAPGNPGTAQIAENVALDVSDFGAVVSFAKASQIDLAIIGPEEPLAGGIVDALAAAGIRTFGPRKAAARIEADKSYAKELMRQRSVPTAEARTFTKYRDARTYVASRDAAIVVKAAGLAKGKGVIVCADPAEGLLALEKIMVQRAFGPAGDTVLVEERLTGQEVSILCFVDGNTLYMLENAQDHKPVGEGDTGPNTGGMGAYSPTTLVDDEMLRQIEGEILVPVVDAMRREGLIYKGVLYAGLMLTAGGPKVLEFNCRLGDPETQPILMRLKSDLVEVMNAVVDDKLDSITLEWDPRPAVCVVMAAGGYPGSYESGKVITGLTEAAALPDVAVFHAGTAIRGKDIVTSGGRVLGVTALGDTFEAARQRCYQAVGKIHFDGAHYRRDIGARALTTSRPRHG